MSTSTNAILAFGFDLGEELPEVWASEEGFEFTEWAEKKAGLKWSADDKDFWKKRDAMLAGLPATLVTHCSGEYPMYFLALPGSVTSAHRGTPVAVAATGEPSGRQLTAMRKFCDDLGIEWKEPAWHIFSYWG